MNDTIFPIKSTWTGGDLTSADIGRRITETTQRLGPLDAAMSNWLLLDKPGLKWVHLDMAPPLTSVVERNVRRNDFSDAPEPHLGYGLVLKGSKAPSDFGANDSINISMDVGSWSINKLDFEIGGILKPPDLSLVTYSIYKGALGALASVWPCPWAFAYAYTLDDEDPPEWDGVSPLEELLEQAPKPRPTFEVAWLAYLSAPLAQGLAPPPEIAWEPTPGGGVILSAVQDRLDQKNADHMRRSRMLKAIMSERVGVERWPGQKVGGHATNLPARVGPY